MAYPGLAALKEMTKIELVEFGRLGARERRIAADELFRRTHDRLARKGVLSPSPEEARRVAERHPGR